MCTEIIMALCQVSGYNKNKNSNKLTKQFADDGKGDTEIDADQFLAQIRLCSSYNPVLSPPPRDGTSLQPAAPDPTDPVFVFPSS